VVIEVVDAAGAIGHVVDQIDELLETATDSSLVAVDGSARQPHRQRRR
jgi:PII-like signaling protein